MKKKTCIKTHDSILGSLDCPCNRCVQDRTMPDGFQFRLKKMTASNSLMDSLYQSQTSILLQVMRTVFIAVIIACLVIPAFGQSGPKTLFSSTDPLDMALRISIKKVKGSKVDSVYFKEKLYYRNAAGINDSIKVGFKRRGNYRLQHCYFPPLWVKIEKKNAKNTIFEGNKKLKLVLPCNSGSGSNDLILREYLCYRLYEQITTIAFKTRLVNIDFTDAKGKKNKEFQLKGIFIEEVDKAAKRCGGKTADIETISPRALSDTCALRFDFFQLLIANTDWSKGAQHNSKLIYRNAQYVPIPYDFDMSGLVDAPYSVVSQVGNDELPINNVKERFYRGFCASNELTQFVRKEFLEMEEKLLAVPDEVKGALPDKEIESIKDYLREFFEILKHDDLFQEQIVNRCREK